MRTIILVCAFAFGAPCWSAGRFLIDPVDGTHFKGKMSIILGEVVSQRPGSFRVSDGVGESATALETKVIAHTGVTNCPPSVTIYGRKPSITVTKGSKRDIPDIKTGMFVLFAVERRDATDDFDVVSGFDTPFGVRTTAIIASQLADDVAATIKLLDAIAQASDNEAINTAKLLTHTPAPYRWELGATIVATDGTPDDRVKLLRSASNPELSARQLLWLDFLAQRMFPEHERLSDKQLHLHMQNYLKTKVLVEEFRESEKDRLERGLQQ